MAIISTSTYLSEVGLRIAREVAQFTPQLFYVKRNIRLAPFALASSILLTVNSRFYLVTAAHSFYGDNVDNIGIMINNVFCKLGGTLINCEPNDSADHEPNKIDMAVFELHNDTVEFIKTKYQFLPWSKISFDHVSSKNVNYLIFGYPASETRKHFPTKEVISSTFTLASYGLDMKYYLSHKIDACKKIMLPLLENQIGKSSSNNITELPELEGISGCGVWSFFDLFSEFPNYKLVSIITGRDNDSTYLYSSRIEVLKIILNKGFGLSNL